jgi:serine/threonine protein kinase
MTPERYKEVGRLYRAALELEPARWAAYLAEVCGGDEALRQEVESLLDYEARGERLIDQPALKAAARAMAEDQAPSPVPSLAGQSIGHFRILSLLGTGGMGQVWLAEDAHLNRKVAIKLLPAEFTADAERMRRFALEARAASALNHPNIMTIHEIGEAEKMHYIVTEYVKGETLRQRLTDAPDNRIKATEAIDLAAQVAAALAAASEAGIVHRDIKPENVMVRRDGLVKVLDFGLAKLTEAAPPVVDSQASTLIGNSGTEPGVVMGTPRYMSPEQWRGENVDARTDIFSLGVMLYEMIAGCPPFAGATASDLVAATLKNEPSPLRSHAPDAPPELERIVGKALHKNREERYQNAGALLSDLTKLLRDREFTSEEKNRSGQAKAEGRIPNKRRLPAIVALAGLVITTAVPLYFILKSRWQTPRVTLYAQVTSDGRLKRDAVVTDGSRVYFSEQVGGRIVLAQVSSAGGETVPFQPSLSDAYLLAISPDRSKLLIKGFAGSAQAAPLWIVPVTGGSPYRLGDVLAHAATWTSNGEWITYSNGGDLFQVRNDGSGPLKLLSVTGRIDWPRWSPDGNRLRFTVREARTLAPKLWEAAADGANPHPLFPDWNKPEGECCGNWSADGKYFLFESVRHRVSDIWALGEESGLFAGGRREPVQLTFGPMNFHAPVPSADGNRIFVIGKQHRGELIRYDANTRQFVTHLSGLSAEGVNFSADGEWISYVTYPEGDLWRSKVDGSQRLQLSYSPLRARNPRWSPDGKRIAFLAQLPGKPWKVQLVSKDGGRPQQLMTDEREERESGWSPDGNSLVFDARVVLGTRAIYLLDLMKNQISPLPGGMKKFSPRWSPDGRYIAALPLDSQKVMLFDFTTQEWRELAQSRAGYPTWSRDGKHLYFTDQFGDEQRIMRARIADGKIEWVADLKDMRLVQTPFGSWFGLAPDDSPLALRDIGIQDIYALDWKAP